MESSRYSFALCTVRRKIPADFSRATGFLALVPQLHEHRVRPRSGAWGESRQKGRNQAIVMPANRDLFC